MLSSLVGLAKRHRPPGGWVVLVLTWAALMCAPAALASARKEADAGQVLAVTVLAGLCGLGLAWSHLRTRTAGFVGGLLGMAVVVTLVGRLLPAPALLGWELAHTFDWLRLKLDGITSWPPPFAVTAAFVWQQFQALGWRLWGWIQLVASGGLSRDPTPFLLLSAFLAWICGFVAIWQIYRHKRPLAGLLLGGSALALLSFFAGAMATVYLIAFLFCLLWLVVLCHLWSERERWEQTGTDYPDDLGTDLAFAVGPGLTLILVLATFFPVIHPKQVRDAVWEVLDDPWAAVDQATQRMFGPIIQPGRGEVSGGGLLPQSHLLGGQPKLGQEIVMYVSTDDPPPSPPTGPTPDLLGTVVPRRYWRGTTFDTYTGDGWRNGPLVGRAWLRGEALVPAGTTGTDLHQTYELRAAGETLLFAVNAPLRLDLPAQSWWRSPGDLVELTGDARRYTVVSRPPAPSREALRAAPPTLPPEISERYLALPDTVPERVSRLATELTAGSETRYDQALAIETFLRAYTYTLEVPLPPANRDLVDYFLFDLQQGYCDYYASAMVVMARAVGIPARLATGYAQGRYNDERGQWQVREEDGHSWVEVYFNGIGWVEFEPTAGQPTLVRSGIAGDAPVVPGVPARAPNPPSLPWPLLVLGGLLALVLAAVIWNWRRRPRRPSTAADLVRERQARLLRWGARLGSPLRDGHTAQEYGQTLGERLQRWGHGARWARARQAGVEAPQEVYELTEAFVRVQYSSKPITADEARQIRSLWFRLRRHLWWLWLGRTHRTDRHAPL